MLRIPQKTDRTNQQYSKDVGCYTSWFCFHTLKNEQFKKEIRDIMLFTTPSKNKICRNKLDQGDKKTCTLKTTKHCCK